jgi:hypothetical protein
LLCSAVVEDTPSTPTCTTGTGAARDGPVCPPFVAVDLFRRLLRPSPPHRAAALISFLSSPQHLCAPAEQLCQDSTHRVLSVSHLSSLLIPLHALRRTPGNSLSSSPPPTLRGRVTETFSDASHLQPYLTSHHTKGPRGKKKKKAQRFRPHRHQALTPKSHSRPHSPQPVARRKCRRVLCARPPLGPVVPVCAAVRARQSAFTRTDARPARTAQRACTSATFRRRAWRIITARAQLVIPTLTDLLATACRPPAPAAQTPDSPLWVLEPPGTFRPPRKSESSFSVCSGRLCLILRWLGLPSLHCFAVHRATRLRCLQPCLLHFTSPLLHSFARLDFSCFAFPAAPFARQEAFWAMHRLRLFSSLYQNPPLSCLVLLFFRCLAGFPRRPAPMPSSESAP